MAWRIEFSPEAAKEFGKLSHTAQSLIRNYLRNRLAIANDPQTLGKPLKGNKAGLWRYRVEKYRVICRIENSRLVILVLRVGKRDKIYDK